MTRSLLARTSFVSAFLALSATAAAQCPKEAIVGTLGQPAESFGSALAVNDELLVVGAPGHQAPLYEQGAAHIYFWNGGAPSPAATILPSDPTQNGHFGSAVALAGESVAVGALGSKFYVPGAVFLFERTDQGWQQLEKLAISSAPNAAEFGFALALDGEQLFVGAPGLSSSGPGRGAVYVYRRQGSDWILDTLLEPTSTANFQRFGHALALDGDLLAVGAPGSSPNGITAPWTDGSVSLFRRMAGSWSLVTVLPDSDPGAPNFHSEFGARVALDAGRLLVGAPAEYEATGFVGKIREYRNLGAGWTETQVISDPDPTSDSTTAFGHVFAIDGEHLIAGAPYADKLGDYKGLGYLFRDDGSGWTMQTQVAPSPIDGGFAFASRAAISNTHVFVARNGMPPPSPYGGIVQYFPRDASGCAPLLPSKVVVSVLGPDSVGFALDAGTSLAGKPYLLLASFAGNYPGIPVGNLTLPLNPDGLLIYTLQNPNSALYPGSFGLLDPTGKGTAALQLPGGIVSLAGLVAQHAYVVLDPAQGFAVVGISDAVAILLAI
ncbi:MAG: hypothetical protein FJ299_08550 [Planctomycetes bacterium]|nr:hypothetical protein [Planctomycetota bacterium]